MSSLNIASIVNGLKRNEEIKSTMSRYYSAAVEAEVNERVEELRAEDAASGFHGHNEDYWDRTRFAVTRNVLRDWHGRALRSASALNVKKNDLLAQLDGAMFYRFSA